MTEWDDVAKGIVAGMLENQVKAKGSIGRWVGIGILVIGLLLAVFLGGFFRGLGVTMVLVGLIIILVVALIRALALGTIRKFAVPHSIAEKREEIEIATEKADLPTGPLSVIRFLFRLRKGVGSEVARLDTILEDLRDEMAATEEPFTHELDGSTTPELPE